MSGRVLVAMSGGVDSSVAAALVARSGRPAAGVTMRLLPRGETGFGCCGSPVDIEDARRVCESLGIPHYVVDMAELFESSVIRPYLEAWRAGRTPNPCAECNRSLKFGHLLALAEAWGCGSVATGHYARVAGGRLRKARDEGKDQSYFLYSLTERELARAEFPVGDMDKPSVRALAGELGLRVAEKPESQEACFVPGRDVAGFLAARGQAREGWEFRDAAGRALGRREGAGAFTVGQRRGLGLSGGAARYVVAVDAEAGTVTVGGEDEVYSRRAGLEAVSWTGRAPAGPFRAEVRMRHRHRPAPALVRPGEGGRAEVDFDEPQRAVAPGQAAVFYEGDAVLGGGIIARAEAG